MTRLPNTNLRLDATIVSTLSTATAVAVAADSNLHDANLPFETTTPQISGDWYLSTAAITANALVVSNSYVSFYGAWQPTLNAEYQELADALVEMTEPSAEDWTIDAPVYSAANFVAAALLGCSYPAPKVFSHGPKSVVFNWLSGGDNLYLTVSAGHIAALVSSPERIKHRFEVSTTELVDAACLLPAIKSAQVNGPVVTKDGSLDLLLQYIP